MDQRHRAEGAVGPPLSFWLNDSRCLWPANSKNKIGVWSRDGRVADVTQTSVLGGDEKGSHRKRHWLLRAFRGQALGTVAEDYLTMETRNKKIKRATWGL
jgi:hypothetical protein